MYLARLFPNELLKLADKIVQLARIISKVPFLLLFM